MSECMRALRIESGLPENLWPFFHAYAIYLLNRTLNEALDWKPPFEILNERLGTEPTKLYLGTLVTIGSAAYARIENIPH